MRSTAAPLGRNLAAQARGCRAPWMRRHSSLPRGGAAAL